MQVCGDVMGIDRSGTRACARLSRFKHAPPNPPEGFDYCEAGRGVVRLFRRALDLVAYALIPIHPLGLARGSNSNMPLSQFATACF